MSDTKHTPGLSNAQRWRRMTLAEREAEQLIRDAAPALLAACEDLLPFASTCAAADGDTDYCSPDAPCIPCAARAAIAAARGE